MLNLVCLEELHDNPPHDFGEGAARVDATERRRASFGARVRVAKKTWVVAKLFSFFVFSLPCHSARTSRESTRFTEFSYETTK